MDSVKTSSDFKRAARLGNKWVAKSFVMQVFKREDSKNSFRLGLTVSRKVGKAVVRNKVKRRFREVVRLCSPAYDLSGLDIILIGRYSSSEREFNLMQEDFRWCLKRLGIGQ